MADILVYRLRDSNRVLYTLLALNNSERRFYAEGEFEGYAPIPYNAQTLTYNVLEECMDLPTDGVFVFPHRWGTES